MQKANRLSLCLSVFACLTLAIPLDSLAVEALPEPAMAENVYGRSDGILLGALDHFVDFYDNAVGSGGDAAYFERARFDVEAAAELPVQFTKIDLAWNRIEGQEDDLFSEASSNYEIDLNAEGLGASVLAVLDYPPSWIRPLFYDASAITHDEYLFGNVLCNDGVRRTGEEQMQEWEEYVERTVQHFGERVSVWQIFNEPLNFTFSQQGFEADGFSAENAAFLEEIVPEDFPPLIMDMIRRASAIIRKRDPSATVSVGGFFEVTDDTGVTPSQELIQNLLSVEMPGGETVRLEEVADALSFHVYPGQFATSKSAAALLDRFGSIAAVRSIIDESGQSFQYYIDEYGNPTRDDDEIEYLPSILVRELALNLSQGVKAMSVFELYDYALFPRDTGDGMTFSDTVNYFLLRSPGALQPAVETPGYKALNTLYPLFAGAVPEEAVSSSGSRFIYRSFLNGMDRVVVLWSNYSKVQDVQFTFPQCDSVRLLRINDYTSDEEVPLLTEIEVPGPVAALSFNKTGPYTRLEPFESVVLTFPYAAGMPSIEPDPQDSTYDALGQAIVFSGHPVRFRAVLDTEGGESVSLPASWSVESEGGMGVFDGDGTFTGLTPGLCTIRAHVGTRSATYAVDVVNLQKNLLRNGGMDNAAEMADPRPVGWTSRAPGATVVENGGRAEWLSDTSESFTGDGCATIDFPALESGFSGSFYQDDMRDGFHRKIVDHEDGYLYALWAKKEYGTRLTSIHLNQWPENRSGAIGDMKISDNGHLKTSWQMVHCLDPLFVRAGRAHNPSGEPLTDEVGLFLLRPDAEVFSPVLELEPTAHSGKTTKVYFDQAYFGPYTPFEIMQPDGYLDASPEGTSIQISWMSDPSRFAASETVRLYWDTDTDPTNGMNFIAETTNDVNTPFVWDTIPTQYKTYGTIYAELVSSEGVLLASDYGGPFFPVKTEEPPTPTPSPTERTGPTDTPTLTPTPTDTPSPTSTPTLTPTSTNTPTPTSTPTDTPTPTDTETPTETPTPEPLPGDINGDERVDALDLFLFMESYRTDAGAEMYNSRADIDGDGDVDQEDLRLLIEYS